MREIEALENGFDFDGTQESPAHDQTMVRPAARKAAGDSAFDAAIRCYVNANAWRIAEPKDLESSLSALPAAVSVLRSAGAIP